MKKIFLSLTVILSFIFYSLYQRLRITDETNTTIPVSVTTTPEPTSNPTQPIPISRGQYKDGEYIGNVTNAYYGNVQIKTVISGGKIADVVFLDYPQDRRTSQMINSQAMPLLKSETIQAQSANVDIVSGATATSQAFRESLQSALTKAQS